MDIAQTERFVEHLTSSQPGLYAYITSLMGDRENAKDVLQETNLVLWRKAAEFDEGLSFAAWSSRIAHFQVLAWFRDRGRHRRRFREDLIEVLAAETAERIVEDIGDRLDCAARVSDKTAPGTSRHGSPAI